MAQQTIYHVVPNGEEWAVKKQGASQASRVAATQKEAVNHADAFARKQAPSRVVIHGENGLIQEQHSFDAVPREDNAFTEIITSPPVLTGLALALAATGVAWFIRRD